MVLTKAVYKECETCGSSEFVKGETYGCDKCKKPIQLYKNEGDGSIGITVFYKGTKRSEDLQFCCWDCLLSFVKGIQRTKYKCDYFVSMPMLHFDTKNRAVNYRGFMDAIKKFGDKENS